MAGLARSDAVGGFVMKLRWIGSGTGAGYYVDLYQREDGRRILIGAEHEDDKPSREDVVQAFTMIDARGQMTEAELLAWGAAERRQRMNDMADVKNNIMTLSEAKTRANIRMNAYGIHPDRAQWAITAGKEPDPLPP